MALVVLLRGVNVGGHKTFRPSVLAKELKRYDVVNIGAAGTFVVKSAVGKTELRAELARRLPFETEVIICKGSDVLRLTASDPFAGQPSGKDVVHFVSVAAKRARNLPDVPVNLPTTGKWGVRIIAFQDQFIVGMYRRDMKAISYLGGLDKLVGCPVTTRNWNTMLAISKALSAA